MSENLQAPVPDAIEFVVTLSDAKLYVVSLPKERADEPVVKAAVQALLVAAERAGSPHSTKP
jgi:hypothetical protein